jgi:hypothetical protein
MKKHIFLLNSIVILLGTLLFSSCKKKDDTPEPAKAELTTQLDGVTYKVDEGGLTGKLFSDNGDVVKSVEINAALDATGKQLSFFIDELKSGKILISPKTGTSMAPKHPTISALNTKDDNPTISAVGLQPYVRYNLGGNNYYAYSGYMDIAYDEALGKITISWSITFKDAAGKEFTSAGSLNVFVAKLSPKPKSEIKDPTPVSAKPTVESITPASGQAGAQIAIAGTNFSTITTENVVKFNGVTAEVTSATATKLTVTAPNSGTTGAVTVKVKNSEITTGPVYTYTLPATFTALSPNTAKVGDQVTISGTNFSTSVTSNEVLFTSTTTGSTVVAKIVSATSSSIVAEVPANAATGPISVKVLGQTASLANNFSGTFTLAPSPVTGAKGTAYGIGAMAVAVDADGNIYTHADNRQLSKRKPDGSLIKLYTPNDFNFKALNSYEVTAIASDNKGKIYAHIRCTPKVKGAVEAYMVSLNADGTVNKEFQSSFTAMDFFQMHINSLGEFFILKYDNSHLSISKLKTDGTFEVYLRWELDGQPRDFGFGADDVMYVITSGSDHMAKKLFKFDAAKKSTLLMSNAVAGYVDGALAQAKFKGLSCIAVDQDDIYVGDDMDYRIRKINVKTGMVTTIAGNGLYHDAATGNYLLNGPLLDVNVRTQDFLRFDKRNGTLYGGSGQRFVLN